MDECSVYLIQCVSAACVAVRCHRGAAAITAALALQLCYQRCAEVLHGAALYARQHSATAQQQRTQQTQSSEAHGAVCVTAGATGGL